LGKRIVYKHHSKPTVIAQAQRLNGFSPVDGDEQTYSNQKDAALKERPHLGTVVAADEKEAIAVAIKQFEIEPVAPKPDCGAEDR
jgi:hypothetical protein